jgi:hypothetical protein
MYAFAFATAIAALLTVSWVVTLAITRREQRRRRMYATHYPRLDDRDSLARFRRIMGR